MENRLYQAPAPRYCTCTNQLLLMPGCECDLCMGIVSDADSQPESMALEAEMYDLGYFEALERLYEDLDFAA